MSILVIFRFWWYFGHFIGFRGILVIFCVLGGILVIFRLEGILVIFWTLGVFLFNFLGFRGMLVIFRFWGYFGSGVVFS